MNELEKLVENAEHIKHDTVKDLAVSVSKIAFSDIKEFVGDHKPTLLEYTVKTRTSRTEKHVSVTVLALTMEADNDEYMKEDYFMTTYNNRSVRPAIIERTIKDMVEYYKKNILKL